MHARSVLDSSLVHYSRPKCQNPPAPPLPRGGDAGNNDSIHWWNWVRESNTKMPLKGCLDQRIFIEISKEMKCWNGKQVACLEQRKTIFYFLRNIMPP